MDCYGQTVSCCVRPPSSHVCCCLFSAATQVALQISALTENTPLHSCGGALGNKDVSYSATHQRLAAKVSSYADKYNQFVVNYAVEWDKVVTARVSAGLKTTEVLRRDLDHYQKKVEELRMQSNKILAKGKMVDDKTKEKLKRNEEKLIQSKEMYNKASRDMCMILEETTERAWKDLHPILVKMAQFDMTLANDEAKGLAEMEAVVIALKGLAGANELKASGRLKELGGQEASMLYTGNSTGTVSLTNGEVSSNFEGMSMGSRDDNATSLPPGSVAPQGMGGFPVQIASNEESDLPLASAVPVATAPSSGDSSWHNPMPAPMPATSSGNASSWNTHPSPSTSEMLSVASSAAPPPTMDQINDAAGYDGRGSSLSVSNDAAGFNGRGSSLSLSSYGSGYIAPAPFAPPPMAAPPPPPATPPPMTNYYPVAAPVGMAPAPAHQWSAPQSMAPSYGAMPPSYPPSNTNPFDQPGTYGRPPPPGPNTNPFDPPAGAHQTNPSTNPFSY